MSGRGGNRVAASVKFPACSDGTFLRARTCAWSGLGGGSIRAACRLRLAHREGPTHTDRRLRPRVLPPKARDTTVRFDAHAATGAIRSTSFSIPARHQTYSSRPKGVFPG